MTVDDSKPDTSRVDDSGGGFCERQDDMKLARVEQRDRQAVEACGIWLSTFEKSLLAERFARHREAAIQAERARAVAWLQEQDRKRLLQVGSPFSGGGRNHILASKEG